MEFTPAHRATLPTLKAERAETFEWLVDIIAGISFDHDEVVVEILKLVSEARTLIADGKQGADCLHIEIESHGGRGYGYSSTPYDQRTDFMYVFKVGKNVKGHYGAQKLLIRKDGTVHMENLKGALEMWAWSQINRRREDNIHAFNLDQYKKHQKPFAADPRVSIELSKSVSMKATVTVRDHQSFVFKASCKIEEIQALATAATQACDSLIDFAKSVKV